MAQGEFKESFNGWYLLGFLAVFLIPTAPATIGWLKVLL